MRPALRYAVLLSGAILSMGASADRRLALLDEAEQSLARGELTRAEAALDTASQMAHAADTELLQVRAAMQAGHYSQAAALAAHSAGDHHEGLTPVALYAWLLALGGQEAIGQRRLADALHETPDDPVALDVARLLDDPALPLPPALLQPPHRFAPYPVTLGATAPPATARVAGNAVLWSATRALVGVPLAEGAKHYWVRNGLGQTVAARRAPAVPGLGLTLLELEAPLETGDAGHAARAPFAGSPGIVADYPPVAHGSPAWPRLHHGFLGGLTLSSTTQRLGITLPAGPRGGAVLDRNGQLAGLAIAPAGVDLLLPVAAIAQALGEAAPTSAAPDGAPVAFDAAYERAMRLALQLIIEE